MAGFCTIGLETLDIQVGQQQKYSFHTCQMASFQQQKSPGMATYVGFTNKSHTTVFIICPAIYVIQFPAGLHY